MPKRRTSLDALTLDRSVEVQWNDEGVVPSGVEQEPVSRDTPGRTIRKAAVKQQTVYLPIPVYEQLRQLAFEERAKMHDYYLEGLDLVFEKRGLKSIKDITGIRV